MERIQRNGLEDVYVIEIEEYGRRRGNGNRPLLFGDGVPGEKLVDMDEDYD